ncbi:MAG: hypothetical protein ABIJ47_03915 [Candidatus Bathyarchaeota archaeon]
MSYINMIPSSSLYMLTQWDPDLKLQAFRGSGSAAGEATSWEITMGDTTIGKGSTAQTVKADLLYEFGGGEVPLKQVYESVKEKTGLPDISLDSFVYVDRGCRLGVPEWGTTVRSTFRRRSLHPGVFKRMAVNGQYPLQGVHVMLDEIKRSFEALPQEVKVRLKPSCLISEYHPDINEDGPAVYALKRPYMVFMSTSSRFWELFDMDYKHRGGPPT